MLHALRHFPLAYLLSGAKVTYGIESSMRINPLDNNAQYEWNLDRSFRSLPSSINADKLCADP